MSTARHIKIELEIHAVSKKLFQSIDSQSLQTVHSQITCPGVWLCQNNGDVELSITALGYTFSGKPLKPRFPLCYHEKFTMDGYFSDVNSVEELEKALSLLCCLSFNLNRLTEGFSFKTKSKSILHYGRRDEGLPTIWTELV